MFVNDSFSRFDRACCFPIRERQSLVATRARPQRRGAVCSEEDLKAALAELGHEPTPGEQETLDYLNLRDARLHAAQQKIKDAALAVIVAAAAASTAALAVIIAILQVLSSRFSEWLVVPPGEPGHPRLPHVCLTSRLLPIPRAAWR